jgi:hypothetical protein
MANYAIDEMDLHEIAAKFDQLCAIFDVIEDEVVTIEERAYQLAVVGRELAGQAATDTKSLLSREEVSHG